MPIWVTEFSCPVGDGDHTQEVLNYMAGHNFALSMSGNFCSFCSCLLLSDWWNVWIAVLQDSWSNPFLVVFLWTDYPTV